MPKNASEVGSVNTQVNKLAVLFGSKLFENPVRGFGVSFRPA